VSKAIAFQLKAVKAGNAQTTPYNRYKNERLALAGSISTFLALYLLY
jgi:hypothetical protein